MTSTREKIVNKPKDMVIDRNGNLRLRVPSLSADNRQITNSLVPVIWGDEFYVSKTALAEKCGVGASNLGTYIASGNPFQGRVLRLAGAEDVLRVYPGVKVTDARESIARVVEFDGARAFMRLDGGRRLKICFCPDGVIRTRSDAAEYAGISDRSLDTKVETGIDGFREPGVSEIHAQWPAAEVKVIDSVPEKKVSSSSSPPSSDVRLADIINAPPDTNFVALVMDGNVILIPVSDAAKVLVPGPRIFGGLSSVTEVFTSGLLTVRL